MKKLILLNPVMTKRSHRRKRRSARKLFSNPVRRRRHKRVRRNPVASVRRRVRRNAPATTAAPRAASRKRRTSHRRRPSGFMSKFRASGSGFVNETKSLFSPQLLELFGGYFVGNGLSNYLVATFGGSLPGGTNAYIRLAYRTAIPLVGAVAIRKYNKSVAQGMVIASGVTLLTGLISAFSPGVSALITAPSTLGGYMDPMSYAGGQRNFGAYLGANARTRAVGSYLGGFAPASGAEPLISSGGADPLLNTSSTFNNPVF